MGARSHVERGLKNIDFPEVDNRFDLAVEVHPLSK